LTNSKIAILIMPNNIKKDHSNIPKGTVFKKNWNGGK
jgi:hypothetical protein